MHPFFSYRNGELHCEEVPLSRVAENMGTPVYLYSYGALMHNYDAFTQELSDSGHLVCFSMKSNSNAAIIRAFLKRGAGVDVVSGGELYRALAAGADPMKIVFSGVGKKTDEIELALSNDILILNIESEQELDVVSDCAKRMKKRARVSVRLNPGVDPETHPGITTGKEENKFGLNSEAALKVYKKARQLSEIDIAGLAFHIGSQLTKMAPFLEAADRALDLIDILRNEGIELRYLDVGGGLGINYKNEEPPSPAQYVGEIIRRVRRTGLSLIFEPGRALVGNAGVLLTRVLYVKETGPKKFVIVDAGMTELIRPALYGSYHELLPVKTTDEGKKISADVVGPVCETTDFFARERLIPPLKRGDLLAVMNAGAYGFVMASRYNSRPLPAEVLVRGDEYRVVRSRETYDDLIRGEEIPDFLK